MPDLATASGTAGAEDRALDEIAVRHHLRRLAAAGQAPWLHAEIARRMADKLEAIRLQPQHWIDWSGFLGGGAQEVQRRYPKARRHVVEPQAVLERRVMTRRWWQPAAGPAATSSELPWSGPAVQLIWSNMALHAVQDKSAVMRSWRQSLAPGGMLMFSCFGPDTVRELKALYRQELGVPAGVDWWDMHDVGDALVHHGFTEPVMDMEHVQLHWSQAGALLAELRSLGGNCSPRRFPGMRTPRWRQQLCALIEHQLTREDSRMALTFEIIYGHAVVGAGTSDDKATTRISEQSVREMLRRRQP